MSSSMFQETTQHKEVVTKFKDFLESQAKYRPSTVRSYVSEIGKLYRRADVLKFKTYPEVHQFILDIKKSENHSSLTTFKIVTVLKLFMDYTEKFGIAFQDKPNPLHLGHSFKKGKSKEPDYFNWAEHSDLINRIVYHPKNSLRDTVLFKLAFCTGLRRQEISDLNVDDIEDGMIHVRDGKGGKSRWVPLDQETDCMLERFIAATKEGPLFRNQVGERLRPKSIWTMMSKIGKSLGIRLYPHKIRHSLPSYLLDRHMELTKVSAILGHSDTRTTLRYTHHSKDSIKKAFDRATA